MNLLLSPLTRVQFLPVASFFFLDPQGAEGSHLPRLAGQWRRTQPFLDPANIVSAS